MRVVNRRKEKETHYIGRGSVFGNPYRIGKDGTRKDVIRKYEDWIKTQPKILKAIYNLPPDAILGCFCVPKACHGDVIIKIWKELHEQD